jgi:hypothetical protein
MRGACLRGPPCSGIARRTALQDDNDILRPPQNLRSTGIQHCGVRSAGSAACLFTVQIKHFCGAQNFVHSGPPSTGPLTHKASAGWTGCFCTAPLPIIPAGQTLLHTSNLLHQRC